MTRTKIPVGLPRQNPTKSYWQTPPLLIADHRTTANLPSKTKYTIIGSGITGTAIAYKLLQEEPNATIVILEARQASSGATGRNGGHCRAGRYLDFKNYLEAFGREDALKLENQLKKEFPSTKVVFYAANLTTAAAVDKLFADVIKDFGKINIVVNTIGAVLKKPITAISEEEYDTLFA